MSDESSANLTVWTITAWGTLAFLITLFVTPFVRRLALLLGAVDEPGERRPHVGRIPRLGGLAVFSGLIVGPALAERIGTEGIAGLQHFDWPLLHLGMGALLLTVIGTIDDIRGVSPRWKLAGQVAAAAIAVSGGLWFDAVTNPFGSGVFSLGWFGVVVSLAWIVAIANAMNLIDGLDGLATGVACIACATITAVAWLEQRPDAALLAITLGSACGAFLCFNFHPATIFLGDSGSLLLGYSLAVLSIRGLQKGTTLLVVLVPLLTLGVPLIDTSVSIVRRYFVAGWSAIFRADQQHIHHRLLAMGLTHQRAVLVMYAAGAALGVFAILAAIVNGPSKAVLLLVAAAATYWAVGRLGYRR